MTKSRTIASVAILAIVLAGWSLITSLQAPTVKPALSFVEYIGARLATAWLTVEQAPTQVVLITPDNEGIVDPFTEAYVRGFVRRIQSTHPDVEIIQEKVLTDFMAVQIGEAAFSARELDRILEQYADCSALVSLAGVPAHTPHILREWQARERPGLVVLAMSGASLKPYTDARLLRCAVVARDEPQVASQTVEDNYMAARFKREFKNLVPEQM